MESGQSLFVKDVLRLKCGVSKEFVSEREDPCLLVLSRRKSKEGGSGEGIRDVGE